MTPTIAVALMTCNRADLTARTVESFVAFNDPRQFVLLHADDASDDPRAREIAREAGFETVVQTPKRMGVRVTRTALIEVATARAPWVLMLENDILSLRTFPWRLFEHVVKTPQVYCLRLYGRYKDADRLEPCLTTHKRRGHSPVEWRPFKYAPEKSQIGKIHWSAQPSVTRSRELLSLHLTGKEPGYFTARVKKNVMAHIGTERTPGRLL